jgi:hypothetical protein
MRMGMETLLEKEHAGCSVEEGGNQEARQHVAAPALRLRSRRMARGEMSTQIWSWLEPSSVAGAGSGVL